MKSVGAYEAKTHFPKLLQRVSRGESLTITRRGRPVARLVPVEDDQRKRARRAAARITERRRRLSGVSVAELMESIHDGHRF